MAGPVSIKIAGLREMDAALGELSKATAKNTLIRVGKQSLEPMAEVARSLAPDDASSGPPDLHRSIAVGTKLTKRQAALRKKRDDKSFAEVFVGATESVNAYAHLVEFGTVDTAPQPFLRPAFQQEAKGTIDRVASGLRPEIEKSAKRAAARALKARSKA